MDKNLWQNWTILACAMWLFVSPFFIDSGPASHPPTVAAWALSLLLALSGTASPLTGEWLDAAIGIVLVLVPAVFVFEAVPLAAVNFVVVGIVVIACAVSALRRDRREPDHAR